MTTATTGKIDTVDWGAIDDMLRTFELPEGAITNKMFREKYGIKRTAAGTRMRILVDSGKFTRHEYYNGKAMEVYIMPVEQQPAHCNANARRTR